LSQLITSHEILIISNQSVETMEQILIELKSINSRLTDLETRQGRNYNNRQNNDNRNRPHTHNQQAHERLGGGARVYYRGGRAERNTNRSREQGHPQTNRTGATGASTGSVGHTQSTEFSKLTKALFGKLQLEHQAKNWANLPKSLSKRIDNILENINLPLTDEGLRHRLQNLGDSMKTELLIIAQGHLNDKLHETRVNIGCLNKSDYDTSAWEARGIYLGRHQDKSYRAHLDEWLAQEEEGEIRMEATETSHIPVVVGGQGGAWSIPRRNSKRPANTSPPSVPTSNSFALLAESIEEATVTKEQSPTPTSPPNKRATIRKTPTRPEPQTDTVEAIGVGDQEDGRQEAVGGASVELPRLMEEGAAGERVEEETPLERKKALNTTQDSDAHHSDSEMDVVPARPLASIFSSQSDLRKQQQKTVFNKTTSKFRKTPVIYDKNMKLGWKINKINANTKVLVITDSQLKQATDIPDTWEVHAFPGAYLTHASSIIEKLKSINLYKLEHIVTHVGVNNRNWTYRGSAQGDLNKLLRNLENAGVQGHFCGVSIPDHLVEKEKDTLTEINKHAKNKLTQGYIEPLPTDQVRIDPCDPHKIHYDTKTVDLIFDNIKQHFL
jgi:hypothetical protein